jgi:hypothetical protein
MRVQLGEASNSVFLIKHPGKFIFGNIAETCF